MKVMCRSSELTTEQREAIGLAGQTNIYNFKIGKVYTVLGICCGADIQGGALLELAGEDYILFAPLCLFEVIDERPSRYWVARKSDEHRLYLCPKEFDIEYFHDRLSDFEPELIPIPLSQNSCHIGLADSYKIETNGA